MGDRSSRSDSGDESVPYRRTSRSGPLCANEIRIFVRGAVSWSMITLFFPQEITGPAECGSLDEKLKCEHA